MIVSDNIKHRRVDLGTQREVSVTFDEEGPGNFFLALSDWNTEAENMIGNFRFNCSYTYIKWPIAFLFEICATVGSEAR